MVTGVQRVSAFVLVGALMGLGLFIVVPQHALAACVTAPSGLVSWWAGDGHAGDIISGNDGTLVNGATFATGFVTSGTGQGFSLDGSNDFVEIANEAAFDFERTDAFSIDAWVKLFPKTAGDRNHFLVAKAEASGNFRGYAFTAQPVFGGALVMGFEHVAQERDVIFGSTNVIDGTFHHVAVTTDGTGISGMKLYVDGNLETLSIFDNDLGPRTILTDVPLTIGSRENGGVPTKGVIDEVEIYNRALTPGEIAALFNAGVVGKCKGVVTVEIDIKPGSFPNSVNLGSAGTVPVAIFSTTDFDATTVDPATVNLAGASVGLRGKSDRLLASTQDVNGDGLIDLVVHVETEALTLSGGDIEAVLEGSTFGGIPIQGTDSVRIVLP